MKDFFSGTDGKLLGEIITTLDGAGFYAYLAGGCVRDYLLGRDWQDIDVATNAKPDEIEKLFPKTLSIGKQFGIMVVLSEEAQIEVATFRTDGEYLDGRHPEFVHFAEPAEDAKRRDFTINALFYDLKEKKIIDFVDGETDLKNRLVKAVGDPRKRFQEDHLRILRALRFANQLDFEIDKPTWDAICDFADKVNEVSIERIRDELRKLFSTHPERALQWLNETGLYKKLFPELIYFPNWIQLKLPFTEENHLSWMVPLLLKALPLQETIRVTSGGDWAYTDAFNDLIQNWCKHWKLSKQDEKNLKLILCASHLAENWQKLRGGVKKDLALSPTEKLLVETLLQLTSAISFREELKSLQQGDNPDPFLVGKDLMLLPASSVRSEVLREGWYLQLEGFLKSREQALNWLKQMVPVAPTKAPPLPLQVPPPHAPPLPPKVPPPPPTVASPVLQSETSSMPSPVSSPVPSMETQQEPQKVQSTEGFQKLKTITSSAEILDLLPNEVEINLQNTNTNTNTNTNPEMAPEKINISQIAQASVEDKKEDKIESQIEGKTEDNSHLITASTVRRMVAHIIDEALIFVLHAPLFIKMLWLYFNKQELVLPWTFIVFTVAIRILYETIFIYFLGGLPGQLLLGLRVESAYSQSRLLLIQSFIRALADRLRFFMSFSFYAVAFLNSKRQHLGDLLSESRVIQEAKREEIPEIRRFFAIILITLGLMYGISESFRLLSELEFTKSGIRFDNLFENNF